MNNIKNFFQNLLKKREKKPGKRVWPRAGRDWELMLLSFLILFLLCGVGSVLLFRGISRDELFQVEIREENETSFVDSALLKKTIDFYENKARNLEEIIAHPKALLDPSI